MSEVVVKRYASPGSFGAPEPERKSDPIKTHHTARYVAGQSHHGQRDNPSKGMVGIHTKHANDEEETASRHNE